jgi:UDP-glucose 4-epimerase
MAHALCDRGEHVIALDNLRTGFRKLVPERATFVEADVGNRKISDLMKQYKVKCVVHFAASTVVPESVAYPLEYYLNNTVKSHTLIDSATRAGVRSFLFSSTAAVYGTPIGERVSEADPPSPQSPYGGSKLMTERILTDAAAANGMSVGILRYFNVAGADPQGRTGQSTVRATHLIKVCVEAALGKRPGVEIFGIDYPTPDGTGVRDYIHVGDLIDVHQLVIDRLAEGGRQSLLFNCGYGRGYSVREVIDSVRRVSTRNFNVTSAPRRAGDVACVVADADRLRKELNWRPRFDQLDTIVEHAYAWERSLQY